MILKFGPFSFLPQTTSYFIVHYYIIIYKTFSVSICLIQNPVKNKFKGPIIQSYMYSTAHNSFQTKWKNPHSHKLIALSKWEWLISSVSLKQFRDEKSRSIRNEACPTIRIQFILTGTTWRIFWYPLSQASLLSLHFCCTPPKLKLPRYSFCKLFILSLSMSSLAMPDKKKKKMSSEILRMF